MLELDQSELLKLYPPYDKIHGPYTAKDGRLRIVLNNSTLPNSARNKTKTISYPKALFESYHKQRLDPDDTIDHIDRNPLNNDMGNLRKIKRSLHIISDVIRVRVENVDCPICGISFRPTVNQYDNKATAGPFCSKSCAGKYGKSVQINGVVLQKTPIIKTYYQLDKI
jgi:hypothetical protein